MENLGDSLPLFDPGPAVSRTRAFQHEVMAYLERYPHSRQVELLQTDLNGGFLSKRAAIFSMRNLRRGFYFPASVYAMIVTGEAVAMPDLIGADGEPDLLCLPLAGSLKPSAFESCPLRPVAALTMQDSDGQPFAVEPRNVLTRLCQQLRARGLHPVVDGGAGILSA